MYCGDADGVVEVVRELRVREGVPEGIFQRGLAVCDALHARRGAAATEEAVFFSCGAGSVLSQNL